MTPHGGREIVEWTIDLSCDAGESPERLADGREAALLALVSSVSIACGGHAGDAATMAATIALAQRFGLAVGAHPSYPDRAAFGRRSVALDALALERAIDAQVTALAHIAADHGVRLAHLKPHGALYHDCAADSTIASVVAAVAARCNPPLVLVGAAGSASLARWRALGLATRAEGFADRRYEADGTLRPRTRAGALLDSAALVAAQALRLAGGRAPLDATEPIGPCATLCVHADTPGSSVLARAAREALERAGITVAAPR